MPSLPASLFHYALQDAYHDRLLNNLNATAQDVSTPHLSFIVFIM